MFHSNLSNLHTYSKSLSQFQEALKHTVQMQDKEAD